MFVTARTCLKLHISMYWREFIILLNTSNHYQIDPTEKTEICDIYYNTSDGINIHI